MIGIVDDELFVVVTTVAFVNDAKKFDVNCEASALISIDETLISGPTKSIKKKLSNTFETSVQTCHNPANICRWLLSSKIVHRYM